MTAKPKIPAKAPEPKRNTHSVPIHVGDGRKIEPGGPIPGDVPDDVRKALEATGLFK